MHRYDRNGNGLLELAEFMQLASELGGLQASGPGQYSGEQPAGRGQRGWSDSDVRAAFRRFDANNSGKLDYKELRAALRGLGVDVDEREAVRVLQDYDEDCNGLMDLREFSRLVRQLQPRRGGGFGGGGGGGSRLRHTDAQIKASFLRHDTNHSGKLDFKELRAALRDLGVRSDEREAVRILQEHDRNGNGLLELSEFTTLVRKLDVTGQEAAPRPSGGGSGGGSGNSGVGGWFGFGSSSKWTDADVRRAFQKYDANSSGRLDYKELRAALQDLGLRHDSDEAVRVLQQFDRSGDGLLSLDEFGKLVRQLADGAAPSSSLASGGRRWSDGDVRAAFVRFDANRSGKLDHRELRAALRELGIDADEREAANVLQRYDANANGRMDLGEFTSLVRQLARSGAVAPDSCGSTAASIMAADARGGCWWASATGAALPSAAPLPAALPAGWVETSEPGSLRVYYYNRETRQTQWHRPGTATPIPSSNSSSMRPTPRMPPNAPPRTPERRLPFASLGESSPLPTDRSRRGSFGSIGSIGSKGSSGGSGGRDRFGAPPSGSGYGDSDPRHITNVINAFVRFDANNSGKLDHRELRAALRHLGMRVDGREAAEILRGYDDNGDGVLSMDEFTTLVRRLPLPSSRKTSWPEGLLGVGGGKKSFFGGSKKPPLHELGA